MTDASLRPYMVRAVYEWCADGGFTPYLAVKVNGATRVPLAYIKNGEIVLNVGHSATRNLTMDNERIQFSARFGGVSHEISVPMEAVSGIFARENGKGMFFEVALQDEAGEAVDSSLPMPDKPATEPPPDAPAPKKPRLTVIK